MPSSVPDASHPDLIAALREDLIATDFTVDGVQDRLGTLAAEALEREQPLPARRALNEARPEKSGVSTLASLFLLGDQVVAADLDAALPTVGAHGAAQLGLVERAGAGADDPVRPCAELRPYGASDAQGPVSWWLASDLRELQTGHALAADHVLGAGGAAATLAQVTVRTPVARALDLGTGSGIQALHASRHASHVIGTDISRRALAYARFNAQLAGVCDSALELREGSMLDPVAHETFDLVVSNPPFVITPRTGRGSGSAAVPDYEYRDGGQAGDDVVRGLVTGVGSVLAPGGVAQMLGNWEQRRGEDWTERVGRWLDDSGLDGWVIQRESLDPAEYAETWIRDGGSTRERDPAAFDAAYGAWLDDFASRDVESIGFGIITLRKPAAGRPGGLLRRLEQHTGSVRQPLGAHLAASLAAHDWLSARDDAALAASHLVVATDVTEERYLTPGAQDPNIVIVRQGDGLGRGIHASSPLAALVGVCDGELGVGQIVGALAALFEVRADELAAELLPAVRSLIRDGFLVPARG